MEEDGKPLAIRATRKDGRLQQLFFLHMSGQVEEMTSSGRKYIAVETMHCIIKEQADLPISNPLVI